MKINFIKRFVLSFVFALFVIIFGNSFAMHASAADVVVRFGSTYYEKTQEETFPMGVYVENADGTATDIGIYHVEITIDTSMIQYASGATGISDTGAIVLDLAGDGINQNKTMVYFKALNSGNTNVIITGAVVYNTAGEAMNVVSLGAVPLVINPKAPETVPDGNDGAQDGKADAQTGNDVQAGIEDTQNQDGAENPDEIDDAEVDDTEIDDTEVDEPVEPEDTEADKPGLDTQIPEKIEEQVEGAVDESVVYDDADTGSTKDDTANTGNSVFKYIIIAAAVIVAIAIIVAAIIIIRRFATRNRKPERINQSDVDEQDWAFEFDTIDEEKGNDEEWSAGAKSLDEDWMMNNGGGDSFIEAAEDAVNGKHSPYGAVSDEEDFLFEFDSVSDD